MSSEHLQGFIIVRLQYPVKHIKFESRQFKSGKTNMSARSTDAQ